MLLKFKLITKYADLIANCAITDKTITVKHHYTELKYLILIMMTKSFINKLIYKNVLLVHQLKSEKRF